MRDIMQAIEDAKVNVPEEKAREYREGKTLGYAKSKLYGIIEMNGGKRFVITSKDGTKGYINKHSVDKMLSNISKYKNEETNITPAQHYAAVADIEYLFKNAIKFLIHPDKKGGGNVEAIHRYAAPLYSDNIAYITVKTITEEGNKIHSIELIEIGKLEGKLNEAKLDFDPNPATNDPED